MNLDFKCYGWRQRQQQSFDKSKITLKKAGEEFNVYDRIQEEREDTEIYPTMEKYGCLKANVLDAPFVYGDFTSVKDLRDIKDKQIAAVNLFNKLPLETRKTFNNDYNQFMKDGEKYLKSKMEKLAEDTKQKATENATVKTETNNG